LLAPIIKHSHRQTDRETDRLTDGLVWTLRQLIMIMKV
jgi:hypothetical protein